MIESIVCPKSNTSARDIARKLLADVQEIPTPEGAARIASDYGKRGGYVDPKWLLDVWMEVWKS